jgi:hypothetical protein
MLQITCTTDPISGKDVQLQTLQGIYRVEDKGEKTHLTVYFESEQNKQAYLDIPLRQPLAQFGVNLDNPGDVFYDIG